MAQFDPRCPRVLHARNFGGRGGRRVGLDCECHYLLLHRQPTLKSRSGGDFPNPTPPKLKLTSSQKNERELSVRSSPLLVRWLVFYTCNRMVSRTWSFNECRLLERMTRTLQLNADQSVRVDIILSFVEWPWSV